MNLTRVAQNLYRRGDSGIYYAVCSVADRVRSKSLRTLNRRKAESKLAGALAELRASIADAGTFAEASEHWRKTVLAAKDLKPLALRGREQMLRMVLRYFPELSTKPLPSITLADCEAWKAKRVKMVDSVRYNNELGTIRMVFEYAISHNLCTVNPALKISRERVANHEAVAPTREQVSKLVADLRKGTRTQDSANMVELICYTGMRQHEAAQLRWDEIDLNRGLLKITGGERGTKNRRTRFLPITAACRELFDRIPRFQDKVLGTGDCRMAVGRACRRLNLPHFGHHSFRHFFATDAIESGVNVRTLAQWLGHLDGGQLLLKTYAHVWPTQEAEAAAKMRYSAAALGNSLSQPEITAAGNRLKVVES